MRKDWKQAVINILNERVHPAFISAALLNEAGTKQKCYRKRRTID
jgi:hypothetical protein